MPAPLVSVVVTTFRRPHLVGRSVASIQAQTLRDIEVIVVDDASGDETPDVLAELVARDARVRVVTHPKNRGLSAARNSGIAVARAPYIAFQDDDDEWLPEKLAMQADVLDRDPSVGVVTCFEQWHRPDGSVVRRDIRLDGDVLDRLRREDLVHMQTLLVRRARLDEVGGFDERLFHHEDMDMALRLAGRCRFATVPEPLHVFHVTAGSLSTNVDNRLSALRTILASRPELTNDRRIHSLWRYRIGRYEAERSDRGAWRRELVAALRLWPLNTRALAALLAGPDANVRIARARNRLTRRLRR